MIIHKNEVYRSLVSITSSEELDVDLGMAIRASIPFNYRCDNVRLSDYLMNHNGIDGFDLLVKLSNSLGNITRTQPNRLIVPLSKLTVSV